MSQATASSGSESRPEYERLLDDDDPFEAVDSEHTELTEIPERAYIEYAGTGLRKKVDATANLLDGGWNDNLLATMLGEGIGIRWLIERAMIDPDATVIPIE